MLLPTRMTAPMEGEWFDRAHHVGSVGADPATLATPKTRPVLVIGLGDRFSMLDYAARPTGLPPSTALQRRYPTP